MENQVYFDPDLKRLFTVKRTEPDRIVISGGAEYYQDAITNIERYAISKEYFQTCKAIDKTSDLLTHDGIGYRLHTPFVYGRSMPNHTFLKDETRELIRVSDAEFGGPWDENEAMYGPELPYGESLYDLQDGYGG